VEWVNYPNEERNLEFKQSVSWKDSDVKAKITKSILAMANLKDGGQVVIGKGEQPDRTFKLTGMNQDDFESFDPDAMKDFVKNYADPYVQFSVRKYVAGGKNFILIKVEEFDTLPIICKKSCGETLQCGQMYTRSRGKPESIQIPTQTEMREIVSMAVEKEMRHFFERMSRAGLIPSIPSEPSDSKLFDKELEGLL
jgi:predicted HTH transcriptional regulator